MSGEIMETRMRATLAVAVLVVVYPAVAFAQLAPQSQAEFEQRFTGLGLCESDAPNCNEVRWDRHEHLRRTRPIRCKRIASRATSNTSEPSQRSSGTVSRRNFRLYLGADSAR